MPKIEIDRVDRQILRFLQEDAELSAETMRRFPEVQECHLVLGSIDFLLRIVVRDIDEYERFFFDKLSHLPEVQEVHSNIVLSEIKYTTALPI